MSRGRTFDVIIVGGGIAGSALGGVLARAGLGVLIVEKEERFRDRIRGEGTWPWGVGEARKAGLGDLLERAGTVDLRALVRYENQRPAETEWELDDSAPALAKGFLHPGFQEVAFTWAGEQGATTVRPAKATAFHHNGRPVVTIASPEGEVEYSARLVAGADGKHSMARKWTGGESDADESNHRMGGVLISGAVHDRERDCYSWVPGEAVNWFAAGPELTRLYLLMSQERLRETGVDRSFEAILSYAGKHLPEGALEGAEQQGPIGYFSNHDSWATRIAGNGVALIGDAAGSPDPSHGHGTSLVFHDVRALSEALLSDGDWDRATAGYATERERVFDVIHQSDLWGNVFFRTDDDAARLREGNDRAREHDPTLMGFSAIETKGPFGLVADEAARRAYFGLDLSS